MLTATRLRQRHGPVAFVGEGQSDRYGALYSDPVFAKDALVAICEQDGVPYRPGDASTTCGAALETADAIPGPVGPNAVRDGGPRDDRAARRSRPRPATQTTRPRSTTWSPRASSPTTARRDGRGRPRRWGSGGSARSLGGHDDRVRRGSPVGWARVLPGPAEVQVLPTGTGAEASAPPLAMDRGSSARPRIGRARPRPTVADTAAEEPSGRRIRPVGFVDPAGSTRRPTSPRDRAARRVQIRAVQPYAMSATPTGSGRRRCRRLRAGARALRRVSQMIATRSFAPDSRAWRLDGDELVGTLPRVRRPDADEVWIGQLATAASHRRRGIAQAMLRVVRRRTDAGRARCAFHRLRDGSSRAVRTERHAGSTVRAVREGSVRRGEWDPATSPRRCTRVPRRPSVWCIAETVGLYGELRIASSGLTGIRKRDLGYNGGPPRPTAIRGQGGAR
jgi:GNAT superfamily N-acetyltransferase